MKKGCGGDAGGGCGGGGGGGVGGGIYYEKNRFAIVFGMCQNPIS